MNPEYTPYPPKKETERKKIRPGSGIVLASALLCALLGAAIPLLTVSALPSVVLSGIAVAILIACILLLRYLTTSFRAIFSYVLLLAGSLLLSGSVMIPALLAALTASVALFAYLCRIKPTPYLLLIPLASYGIAFAILQSPLLPAAALFPYPAALMLYMAIRVRADRVSMICRTSIGIAFSAALALCLWYLLRHGIPSIAHIRSLVDYAREALSNTLSEQMLSVYRDMGMTLHQTDVTELVRLLVSATFNLLPAILCLLCFGISFMIQGLLISLLLPIDNDEKEWRDTLRHAMHFEISVPSAVIFLLCGVLMLVFSASSDMAIYATVAQNFFLILVPGLAVVTVVAFRMHLIRKGPSCMGSLLYVLFITSFLYLTLPMLLGTAVAGAVITIWRAIKSLRAKKA